MDYSIHTPVMLFYAKIANCVEVEGSAFLFKNVSTPFL